MERPRALRILVTGAAMAGMLMLGGCAEPAGPAFADLRREATAADTLPISLPDYVFEDVDPDTIRYVGQYEGADVYLARGTEAAVCVLAYPDEESWVSGCSGPGLTVRGPNPPTYLVTTDGAELPGNAEPISENVAALVSPLAE